MMAEKADVLVYNYRFLLDPRLTSWVKRPERWAVIFEDSHDIDQLCLKSLSVQLTNIDLAKASQDLQRLGRLVTSTPDLSSHLDLKSELDPKSDLGVSPEMAAFMKRQVEGINLGYVPGSIRKPSHFLGLLARLLHFCAHLLVPGEKFTGNRDDFELSLTLAELRAGFF